MTKAIEVLSRIALLIAGVGIVVMLVLVVADVLLRAIWNVAIPGNDTVVASYLMVATIFLPLALLQLLDENIAVDVLYSNMPAVVRVLFDIIAQLAAVVFYLLLGWIYFKVAVQAFEIKEFVTGTWNVPIWPARVLMPAGLFLGALAAMLMLIRSIRALFSGPARPPHGTQGAL